MGRVLPLRSRGVAFSDTRGEHRALQMTWHHEDGIVVLSLWRAGSCTGTFRLAKEDVPELVRTLAAGLVEGYDGPPGRDHAHDDAG